MNIQVMCCFKDSHPVTLNRSDINALYVQLADSLCNLHSIWSNSDFMFWTSTFIGCREQKRYGKTLGGKAVDIGKLSELASLG
jgi:hypothetical protein